MRYNSTIKYWVYKKVNKGRKCICVHVIVLYWFTGISIDEFHRWRNQPKSVGKMADSETLTHCISLNSIQMCTYFWKDLVTGYCVVLVKSSILSRHPFSNWFYYPHLLVMGLLSHEIRLYLSKFGRKESAGSEAQMKTVWLLVKTRPLHQSLPEDRKVFLMPGLHLSKDCKHVLANMIFKLSRYGLVSISLEWSLVFTFNQIYFTLNVDTLTAL